MIAIKAIIRMVSTLIGGSFLFVTFCTVFVVSLMSLESIFSEDDKYGIPRPISALISVFFSMAVGAGLMWAWR